MKRRPTRSAYGYSSHANPLPNWREFLSPQELQEVRVIDRAGAHTFSARREELRQKAWPARAAAIAIEARGDA